MPSWIHDGLVALFHDNPETIAHFLEQHGLAPPRPLEAASNDMTDISPAELRADAVFFSGDPPSFVAIVEVQRFPHRDKRFVWPAYLVNARLRHRCPVVLLVVTLDHEMSRWSARPIEFTPGQFYRPLVIGPDSIPVITDERVASAQPELACLSALVHHTPDVVRAAADALWPHPTERNKLCLDILMAAFASKPHLLEEIMRTRNYEYQSEFARKYYQQGLQAGREEGLEAGREQGLEAGREQGLEAGREQGLALGRQSLVQALFQLLATRGIPTSDAQKARIMAAELTELQAWIPRAAMIQTATELFAE